MNDVNAPATDESEDALIQAALLRLAHDVSGRLAGRDADKALWLSLCDDGWCLLPLDESAGGAGARMTVCGPALEGIAHAGRVTQFLTQIVIAAQTLATGNSAGRFEPLLRQLGSGEASCVLGLAGVSGGERRALAPTASEVHGGWQVRGVLPATLAADEADYVLVPAISQHDGTELLFLLPVDRATLAPYPTWGDMLAADLKIDQLAPASALVASGAIASDLLDRAGWRACVGGAWEAIGQMRALIEMTREHVTTRRQFGRPLSALQSVQQRIAEMWLWLAEIRALVTLASQFDADEDPVRLATLVKTRTIQAARYVARQAVQLHGAMGVTEESQISTLFRRLMSYEQLIGDGGQALDAYAALIANCFSETILLPRDHGITGRIIASPADVAFRAEVREFLDAELTPAMREAQENILGVYPEHEAGLAWQRKLDARGWGSPLWPADHGGCGWSSPQRFIFEAEAALANAPVVSPFGLRLAGPVIIRYGTDDQRQRYLPPTAAGEMVWCQGFSEPDAGSDLASLTTHARRDCDGYIINGTKIWTTRAHVADMMFALLRTSNEGKAREGLSMFLIPMGSHGMTVRPILSITGDHELNQVFFDDVRVGASARLGDEGEGWEIARYLLDFERGGGLFSARHRSSLGRVRRAVDAARPGLFNRDWATRRFAEVAAAVDSFELLEFSVLGGLEPGKSAGSLSSVLKLRSSRLKQEIGEMAVELLGSAGADRMLGRVATIVADHLEARATTIFGGASEVQLDIIARSLIAGAAI